MIDKKNWILISIALLGGVLIGLSIAWFVNDTLVDQSNSVEKSEKKLPANKQEVAIDEEKVDDAIQSLNNTIEQIDRIVEKEVSEDTLTQIELDSNLIPLSTDSLESLLKEPSIAVDTTPVDEGPVVLKAAKRIAIVEVRPTPNPTESNQVDSLLSDVSKINSNPVVYKVEFWQSPVQFTGYKYMNRKILLYGIPPTKDVEVNFIGDTLQLRCDTVYYRMVESYDSRTFL